MSELPYNITYALMHFGGRPFLFAVIFLPPLLTLLTLRQTKTSPQPHRRVWPWVKPIMVLIVVVAYVWNLSALGLGTNSTFLKISLLGPALICFFSFQCGYLLKGWKRYAVAFLFPATLILYWWAVTMPSGERIISEMVPAMIAATTWSLAFAFAGAVTSKLRPHDDDMTKKAPTATPPPTTAVRIQ